MNTKETIDWICRSHVLVCGPRTLVMGILNVTPDSFSDGGRFTDPAQAAERALEMAAQGADLIDIGGESTRPGAAPVDTDEEIRRVVPVIRLLRPQTKRLISIDTQKADVAQAALDEGADVINDISALGDPAMAALAARTRAGLILMHMQGTPQTMQNNPAYTDVLNQVTSFLSERMRTAIDCGVDPRQIALDPGIGFGKADEHNLSLLQGIPVLAEAGRPILIGASRKSFLGRLLGRSPDERLAGSLAVAVFAALQGAHILRVHDVIETCDALRFADTMRSLERSL